MLEFAAKHNVKPWITKYPFEKANEAVVSMDKGESRYRHVLVNTNNGGEL
jgi:alcohol dehydrogenase (NADP+)